MPVEQQPLRRHACLTSLFDRAGDPLAIGEAKLDEHVCEEAAQPATTPWRSQARYNEPRVSSPGVAGGT